MSTKSFFKEKGINSNNNNNKNKCFFQAAGTQFPLMFFLFILNCFSYKKVPLCMVDLAQTIEEWKDLCSVKVDDQVYHL